MPHYLCGFFISQIWHQHFVTSVETLPHRFHLRCFNLYICFMYYTKLLQNVPETVAKETSKSLCMMIFLTLTKTLIGSYKNS